MTSKTRWVAIDIHHSAITGLPPYHSILCTYHNTITPCCTYEMPWDLRYLVFYPPFLYTLWDMVFHAISQYLNHLISTHIGVISYLLHIVSTISINHYISHISYILYSSISFYTRYCIFIASASSPARHLVAYPIYIPYILYRYDILYHLSYLSTVSCVFLYLVVSIYLDTISWMV